MRHPFIEDEEENIRGRIYLIINWKTNLYKSFTFFIERFCLFFFYFFFPPCLFFQVYKKKYFDLSFQFPLLFFFLSRSLVCKKESSMFNFFSFYSRGIASRIEWKREAARSIIEDFSGGEKRYNYRH